MRSSGSGGAPGRFPGGKRFAFTIFDDTDVSTVENVAPIYRLLERLGMRTTKTVWPVACPEGSPDFGTSETLEDPACLEFVKDLERRGFEITWHGATMESSARARTEAALERFRDVFGHYPRLHANHGMNRENLYWGSARIDDAMLKVLYRLASGQGDGSYLGHVEGTRYWWGDLCELHMQYVRNLTFDDLNLARINPSMPYEDRARPRGRLWFSAADAEDVDEFNHLLRPEQQDELERDGGFSIVATHFGKGFVVNGRVHPLAQERLEALAARSGWFPTAGELLDWLLAHRETRHLGAAEWRVMQWRWAFDLVRRRLRQRRRRRR